MHIPKVSNMTSPTSGQEVANQFIIETENGEVFQSYDSIIGIKERGQVTLDETYWEYSTTTAKYRNQWLGEKKPETQRKIDSGEYKLANLNIRF
jgi:hypothetical protein